MGLQISASTLKARLRATLLLGLLAAVPGFDLSAQSASEAAPPSGQATSASPEGTAPMSKAEVLAALYKLYDQAYQFGDAVAKLPAADWKFGGRKRALFYEKAAAVRASITELRKPWDAFYKEPDDPALGGATLSAIKKVTAQMNDFIAALADTPGDSQIPEFKAKAATVTDGEHQLEPYVGYLQASAQPAAPPQPTTGSASNSNPASPAAAAVTPSPSSPGNPSEHAETAPAPPAQPAAASSASTAASPANPPSPSAAQPPATTESAAQPAVTPMAMQPADVQALLYKIYSTTFRIGDLAGSLPADKWSLSSQDQAAFTARLDALRAALADAEKSRTAFYAHPEDPELARTTDSALQGVMPKLDDFIAELSSTPGSASASDFKQAESDLAGLDRQLDPFIAYLADKEQPAPSAGGLETEVVKTPESVTPLSSGVVEAPPEDQAQVKAILFKAYEPAFRLKDLLAQEHPDQWHASQADRTAFVDASKTLTDRIADLDKWRDQLDSHPDSLEAAFEAYASLGKLVEPADAVGKIVGEYGNVKIGAEYGQDAEQVEEARDQLEPYLDYLLRHHDHTVGAIERDFVACESQLGFAMRPSVQQAVSMKNINPVFRGRGKRTSRTGHSEKKTPAKEKTPAAPAAPAPH
jgi:hypothetical protein